MIEFRGISFFYLASYEDVELLYEDGFPAAIPPERFLHMIEREQRQEFDAIVMSADGEYVGYAIILDNYIADFLYYIYICPEYRNKGYGSVMLQHIKEMHEDIPVIAATKKVNIIDKSYYKIIKLGNFLRRNGFVHLQNRPQHSSMEDINIYVLGEIIDREIIVTITDSYRILIEDNQKDIEADGRL